MWFLNILLLIFILGILIFIHELGHFLVAKHCKVHIYEFSLGMGPVILRHVSKKDNINYCLRAFPIGGFVSMAGEVYEDDETKKVKKEDFMCNKKWYQRLAIIVAGVFNNFVMAIVLLFLLAIIWGAPKTSLQISDVVENSAIAASGIVVGDTIVAIDGKNVTSWDKTQLYLNYKNGHDYYEIEVKHEDGNYETYQVKPTVTKDEDGDETRSFGFAVTNTVEKGFIPSISYAFTKFGSVISSMCAIIGGLFTGKLSLSSLSGPVGMYQVVGESAKYGIENIIYLIAYLSINLGFINILPFPAFDGGHAFFIIIEKIKGSPINKKFENICHTIGFILLMILMIVITIGDIIRIF